MSSCRLALVCLGLAFFAGTVGADDFIEFESGPVRPLALSPDGARLFAVNTPDGRLEIFNVGAAGIAKAGSVQVGLEPVAVAAVSSSQVWVVNHLSDSISIVDVASTPPRVIRTLLVGDEPRDIVFAGPGGTRAFITTAHRGQQRTDPSIAGVPGAGDPQLTTASPAPPADPIGRADVWVFDSTNLGSAIGGLPLRIVTLFGDTPRALAVSPSGGTVYAAIHFSGNRTTTIGEGLVCNGFNITGTCSNSQSLQSPGGVLPPATDHLGNQAPEVGIIVKYNQALARWEDERGRDWSQVVRFSLPDYDVFAIDASTLAQSAVWSGVGTTIFNVATNPITGTLYVSNTDAQNDVRFEGPGTYATTSGAKPPGEPATVQGNLAHSQITVVDATGGLPGPSDVMPRHLNKHINYTVLPAPAGTSNHSLATPLQMALTADGLRLYVAAFGSSKIGVFDTATLEDDSFNPTAQSASYLPVSGGGPGGLVLDGLHDRLYVLTRFDNAVSVIDLSEGETYGDETAHIALHNPEPASVVAGRPFLYDANATSSNGEASCSSCHIFGDLDQLAWDLGNPDDEATSSPMTIRLAVGAGGEINGTGNVQEFSALKGPMTTQTLRGMSTHGPMHWRGDRSNGFFGQSATDEDLSFRNFIVAFPGLVGRSSQIANTDMQSFSDFQLQVELPPNPNRAIDNSLTPAQANGRAFFMGQNFASNPPGTANDSLTGVGGGTVTGRRSDGVNATDSGFTCDGCHRLSASEGFFGGDGLASFENESQILKVPHLRNLYQKVGMFGKADEPFTNALNMPHQGDQLRGFGFLHDGSFDTVFHFINATVFNEANPFGAGTVGFTAGTAGDGVRRDVEQFMLAFDSDLAPVVGQQVTLNSTNSAVVGPRITTLIQRAGTPFSSAILGLGVNECDLVVKGNVAGVAKGWQYLPGTGFRPSDGGPDVADATLRALATTSGQELTYTCVTPGAGQRAGIDRDRDGDLDNADNCSDVANASQNDGDLDARGDVCDNCAAKANASQSDIDADGTGDVCDNQCIPAGSTTASAVLPASGRRGLQIEVVGTGFGPSAQVSIGGVPAATSLVSGQLVAIVPLGALSGNQPVTVLNPEGCQSQEALVFNVKTVSCGLTGIEPFLLLGLLGVRRLANLVA